jgi:hypothetical protein
MMLMAVLVGVTVIVYHCAHSYFLRAFTSAG